MDEYKYSEYPLNIGLSIETAAYSFAFNTACMGVVGINTPPSGYMGTTTAFV